MPNKPMPSEDLNSADDAVDILFISPDFFGYAAEITKRLTQYGHTVAFFNDRPATDSVTKALIRIHPQLAGKQSAAYFQGIIRRFRGRSIKHVFVIKGEAMSPQIVREMRQAFPVATFTMYFWDSFRNMPSDARDKARFFDRVLTFDPQDASQNQGLIYQPLFFLDEYARVAESACDIDVLFIGTAHSDRYKTLRKIKHSLPKGVLLTQYLYFPAKWLYYCNCCVHRGLVSDRKDVFFRHKQKSEIVALMSRSRVVVDIERTVQSGYTMRTLEVLGAGKKLITTNSEVRHADFYDPRNILIIDRRRPVIPAEFFETPYVSPSPAIVAGYGLDVWLKNVLPFLVGK